MTSQLEDRVIGLEEFARDTNVELRNITYRLDTIEQRLSTLETGMERIENVQMEHSGRFESVDTQLGDIQSLLVQVLEAVSSNS